MEEKYPEIMQKSMDGDMSMPAGSDTSTPPDDGSMQKFPAFEGKDLDGNTVKSDELFSGNTVTVVYFWFTTCNPCVKVLTPMREPPFSASSLFSASSSAISWVNPS